jgi:hypothetical protein
LNYVYWQTLGINGFDQVSHFLRIVVLRNDCSGYQNDPDEHLINLCSTGVGPYQPCIETQVPGKAEGPTSLIHNGKDLCTLEALEGEGASVGEPAAVVNTDDDTGLGRRRTRGQPEAPPLPGQPDISKPQITLPPQIQELLDKLQNQPPPQLPELPRGADDVAPDQLLNYLLAP